MKGWFTELSSGLLDSSDGAEKLNPELCEEGLKQNGVDVVVVEEKGAEVTEKGNEKKGEAEMEESSAPNEWSSL